MMKEVKKILIQRILEIQDESLLKLLLEVTKLDQQSNHFFPSTEVDFLPSFNIDSSEIQDSIDGFFNPHVVNKA
jgi:hypothetical protein